MTRHFKSAVTASIGGSDEAFWFAFAGSKLLCDETSAHGIPLLVDFAELGLAPVRQQYLGLLDERHCFSVELAPGVLPPEGMSFKGLRQAYGFLDEELFALAGRAVQIVDWDRDHQFCGRCGTRMEASTTERSKQCPCCNLVSYPRLSPSIIVRISREDQILLARSYRFPSGMYSVLAGFVEPGETLEQTVEREVYEEAGITLKNIRYFGSQPWPFPNSLMIAYTAEYAGGDLRPDPAEIEDARWFTADTMPLLPLKMSIARRMIDDFLEPHTDHWQD